MRSSTLFAVKCRLLDEREHSPLPSLLLKVLVRQQLVALKLLLKQLLPAIDPHLELAAVELDLLRLWRLLLLLFVIVVADGELRHRRDAPPGREVGALVAKSAPWLQCCEVAFFSVT